MGYNASYDQTDFQNIVVDGIGTAGAGIVVWIPTLVLGAMLLVLIGIYGKVTKAVK